MCTSTCVGLFTCFHPFPSLSPSPFLSSPPSSYLSSPRPLLFPLSQPAPPSAPNNLTLVDVSRRTVSLSWDPPHFLGSRGTFFYTIWYRREGDTEWTRGDNVTNGNGRVVNYTQSGLVPHSQHIVRVTADSMATDTVPEELAHLRSLNITVMTLPDGEALGAPCTH